MAQQMNAPATSTSLVQRIEAALSGNDLHSSEVAGLIEAATAAEARLENLIAQLHLLLTAVVAQEKQEHKSAFAGWENEPIVNKGVKRHDRLYQQ
jgi:hypothetical protein